MIIREYKVMVEGNAHAPAIKSDISLSFWGGVRAATGDIEDIHNDLCGENMTGKILCIPYDRGSCSSSGVMLEMIRKGTSPVAVLCIEAEAVLALGPIIGNRMYNRTIAMRAIPEELFHQIPRNSTIAFTDDAILINEE